MIFSDIERFSKVIEPTLSREEEYESRCLLLKDVRHKKPIELPNASLVKLYPDGYGNQTFWNWYLYLDGRSDVFKHTRPVHFFPSGEDDRFYEQENLSKPFKNLRILDFLASGQEDLEFAVLQARRYLNSLKFDQEHLMHVEEDHYLDFENTFTTNKAFYNNLNHVNLNVDDYVKSRMRSVDCIVEIQGRIFNPRIFHVGHYRVPSRIRNLHELFAWKDFVRAELTLTPRGDNYFFCAEDIFVEPIFEIKKCTLPGPNIEFIGFNESKSQTLYRMFNAEGFLLYVGISSSAQNRFRQHFDKQHWANEVTDIKVEHFRTREEVLAAERDAIKLERPRYNVTYNK